MSSPKKKSKEEEGKIVLNKYQIVRMLGRGSFAKVYSARSLSDDCPFALKVIPRPASSAAGDLILREISAMRRLSSHPHILTLHELLATRSSIFLVLDLAPGGDLLSLLRRRAFRPLPDPLAARLFLHLLSALRFSHTLSISHRDIKPHNLLLGPRSRLLVSDFGLSALPHHRRSSDGLLSTACGTPAFAAPEISHPRPYDGARADAWSCGAVLFFLLAGFPPFDDSNLPAMFSRMCRREYRFPPWVSPAARRVVSALLDPDPATRATLNDVAAMPWVRRAERRGGDEVALGCDVGVTARALNAFDIISLSEGLDLSRLFEEEGRGRRERRFLSAASAHEVVGRVKEVGGRMGYVLEKSKEGGVRGGGRRWRWRWPRWRRRCCLWW